MDFFHCPNTLGRDNATSPHFASLATPLASTTFGDENIIQKVKTNVVELQLFVFVLSSFNCFTNNQKTWEKINFGDLGQNRWFISNQNVWGTIMASQPRKQGFNEALFLGGCQWGGNSLTSHNASPKIHSFTYLQPQWPRFEGRPTLPKQVQTRVIWVLGIYIIYIINTVYRYMSDGVYRPKP